MSDILSHVDGGVMTLTFNRLDKKNSITESMYKALADGIEQAQNDPAVRVLVFQGHETVFCAGNDIADFLHNPPFSPTSPILRLLHNAASFTKPMLASVAGPAVGIGTTLLFHCDLVYAGDNAAFAMPFVNLGVCPEAGSSLLAPQLMGYHRAAEALLLGEPFMAEAALEIGLVNRVLPPTEVNSYTQTQARKLAAKPLSSLMETKRLMKAGQAKLVMAQMDDEAASFVRMLKEPAAVEAFSAFMEKRKPDFSKL